MVPSEWRRSSDRECQSLDDAARRSTDLALAFATMTSVNKLPRVPQCRVAARLCERPQFAQTVYSLSDEGACWLEAESRDTD